MIMKTIVYSILISLAGLVVTSCSDDSYVDIISINTFGNKVCRNNNVKVFVTVDADWDEKPSYTWGCNGGTMTNPQGLFENVWKSPDVPGTYEIWCEVKSGNSKEKKSAYIIVTDELFYSDFEAPYYNEGYSNSSMTLAQNSSALKLTSTGNKGVFQKNWDNVLHSPYSMQMRYNPQTFSKGYTIDFRIAFNEVDESSKILRNVNFSIEPSTGATSVYAQYVNKENGKIETATTDQQTLSDLKFTKKWMYISVSLDASNKFIVYADGQKIIESNILTSQFPQSQYPIKGSGVAMSNKAVSLVDDMTVMDNGEICNATARTR